MHKGTELTFSERGAAKYLGISPLTLRSYRQQRKIKPQSVFRIIIYDQRTLDEFRDRYLAIIEHNRRRIGWGTTRDENGKRLLPKDFARQLIEPHKTRTIFSKGGKN